MNSILLIFLLASTPVSPRVHGMGVNFGRIIEDTPTDVVYNPARIMEINKFILFSNDLLFREDSLVQGIAFRHQKVAFGLLGNVRVSDWGGLSQSFLTQRDSSSSYLEGRNRVSSDEELNDYYSIIPIIGYSISDNVAVGLSYTYKLHEIGQRFDVEDRTVRYEYISLPGTTWVDTIRDIFDSSFVETNDKTQHSLKFGSSFEFGEKSFDFRIEYGKSQSDSVWNYTTENDSFNKFSIRKYIREETINKNGNLVFELRKYILSSDFSYNFSNVKLSLGTEVRFEGGGCSGEEFIDWLYESWVLYNDTVFSHDTIYSGDESCYIHGSSNDNLFSVYMGSSFPLTDRMLFSVGLKGSYEKLKKKINRGGYDWNGPFMYWRDLKKRSLHLFSGFEYKETHHFLFTAEYTGRFGLNFEIGRLNEEIVTIDPFSTTTIEIDENISDFSFTYCVGMKFNKNFELMFVMHNYEYGNFGFVWEF